MDKIKLAERIQEQEQEELSDKARWRDDDDIEVDLLAASRTRKLKKIQGKSIISGEEFDQRLKTAYSVQQGLSQEVIKKKFGWATRTIEEEKQDTGKETALTELLKTNTEITYKTLDSISSAKKFSVRSQGGVADQYRHKGVLKSMCFHPSKNIVATGGMDKRLKVLAIEREEDRIKAKKLVGVYLKDLPLQSAHFLKQGREILLTGARKHFYSYDLEKNKLVKIGRVNAKEVEDKKIFKSKVSHSGNYVAFIMEESEQEMTLIISFVAILCGRTKHVLFTLKVEGGAKSVAFHKDESTVFIGTGRGKVFQFQLRTFGAVGVWNDEGALEVSELGLSPEEGYLATGQSSGIVNLYDIRREKPELIKSFKNLGTEISGIQFHPSGRAFAYWSRWKKQGIRVAEIDELKVVHNFPRIQDTLHFPMCAGFSHAGQYLGVGNDEGMAKFFKVFS